MASGNTWRVRSNGTLRNIQPMDTDSLTGNIQQFQAVIGPADRPLVSKVLFELNDADSMPARAVPLLTWLTVETERPRERWNTPKCRREQANRVKQPARRQSRPKGPVGVVMFSSPPSRAD